MYNFASEQLKHVSIKIDSMITMLTLTGDRRDKWGERGKGMDGGVWG